VVEILSRCGRPTETVRPDMGRSPEWHTRARFAERLVTDLWAALDQQSPTVPGTAATDTLSFPDSRTVSKPCRSNAHRSPRWRRCLMRTLLPQS
jgi:hypothetical protein